MAIKEVFGLINSEDFGNKLFRNASKYVNYVSSYTRNVAENLGVNQMRFLLRGGKCVSCWNIVMSWIRQKSLDRKRGEMVRQSRGVRWWDNLEGWVTEKSLFLLGTELYSEYGHSLVTDLQWLCHRYDETEWTKQVQGIKTCNQQDAIWPCNRHGICEKRMPGFSQKRRIQETKFKN